MRKGHYLLVVALCAAVPIKARAVQPAIVGVGNSRCSQALALDPGLTVPTAWAEGYVTALDRTLSLARQEPSGGIFPGLGPDAKEQFLTEEGIMMHYCKMNPTLTIVDAAQTIWNVLYRANHRAS